MNVTISALVARKNNKIIAFVPIKDIYSEVQLVVTSEDIDEQQLEDMLLNIGFGVDYIDVSLRGFVKDGYYYIEEEAKDICGQWGDFEVSIEEKEMEWE